MSLEDAKLRLEEAQAGVRRVQRELGRFMHFAPLIRERISGLRDRMAVLSALDGAVSSGPLFAIEGFVPRSELVDLQHALEPFACALRVKDAEPFDERVPVDLSNGSLVSGFESVVSSFSGMRYGEKDFTWAVGILFVTLGSLCLLDAGYGLLLALLGLGLRARGAKAMGNVFALTGVISVVVGLMAGQFFGLIVGRTVMLDSRPLLTLSSEPFHAFLFSLFVGMITLGFSYSMAIWQRGLRTEATGALFLVLATLSAVYANMAAGFVHELFTGEAADAAALASAKLWGNSLAGGFGAAALWGWIAFPGPVFGEHARVGNILWTVYSGSTGFVQDVLSHMRLFGIALSGGIMALVVNQIAGRFPLPVTALFAVVGHSFVFLLSLLSLYIHTNRLIFLEWGSKCIDGGSNFYAPLRRSSA
jgi:V/A-type H+-transporting ATPase subunit I